MTIHKSPEREEIERVAQQYRERGYRVLIEPRGNDIPSFLRGTSPDLLVFSVDESVLIEVKRTSQVQNAQDLAEFARRIEAHPGWRFELITINPLISIASASPRTERWTRADIQGRLEEARLAASAGYLRAALLIAFAATEAAAFEWAEITLATDLSGVPLRTLRALVRKMVFEGVLGQREFTEFQRVDKLRNAVAHGVTSAEVVHVDVDVLINLATTIMNGSTKTTNVADNQAEGRKVFVAHGHDEVSSQSAVRFLENLGLEPIVLRQQSNVDQTMMEKLEQNCSVAFAIVILTSDDVDRIDSGDAESKPRVRDNFLLELGMLLGRLGRGRVMALVKGEVKIPADANGLLYLSMDEAGAWKLPLAGKLKAAGFGVDPNDVFLPRTAQ